MEFAEVVRRRRMVRRYDPDRPVPSEVIDLALRNAIRAPSAGFSQGWDFVVLTKPEDRQAYWTATADPDEEPDLWLAGMQSAPALILCLSDKGTYLRRYAEPDKGWTDLDEARWPVPYWDIDTGMAALLMLLTGVDKGLGGCFFGAAARDARRRLRGIRHPQRPHPRGRRVVGLSGVSSEERKSQARPAWAGPGGALRPVRTAPTRWHS